MRIFSKQRFKINVGVFEFLQKGNIRHNSGGQVRVRFAPSPTGFLHLGGLRTALFNHLFAKSQNGVSLIRIEDTDQNRLVENAVEALIRDLKWCGIEYDEPPVFQSKRIEIYKKYIEQLITQGDAYHCFCSKVRLNLVKREGVKRGETAKYDNKCRTLSKAEVESKLQSGQPSCIRFKLSSFQEGYTDMVYGNFHYDPVKHEGDPVILKEDGFPTYHFANVVDDHLMNITHVLRGVEWQISTPKHLLLYRAFGWTPPAFGHLPLLLNENGTKVSKRVGGTEVRTFREKGFLPNALLNFVSSFGSGFDIESKEKNTQVFSLQELAQSFDINRVKTSSCIVTFEKLHHFNKLELEKLLNTEEGIVTLTRLTKSLVQDHFKNSTNLNLEDEYVRTVVIKILYRIRNLRDLVEKEYYFLWIWENTWNEDDNSVRNRVEDFAAELIDFKSEWTEENVQKFINDFMKEKKVKKVAFLKSLRLLFTGMKDGPSVAEVVFMLGKDITQFRLTTALKENKQAMINN